MPEPRARAVILVHGGFLGGWCWERVADRLTAAGLRVFAPTLAGLGDRAHLMAPDVDLSTHIGEIAALIEDEGLHDIVLCGHSYAGMVISGVAERMSDRLHALIYLDAILPDPGSSLWDLLSPDARANLDAATVGHAIAPARAGETMVSAADAAWVDARATAHPRATLLERLPLSGRLETVPIRIYVFAERYGSAMLRRCADRASVTPGWQRFDLPHGHDLMIDAPAEVATILAGAACLP